MVQSTSPGGWALGVAVASACLTLLIWQVGYTSGVKDRTLRLRDHTGAPVRTAETLAVASAAPSVPHPPAALAPRPMSSPQRVRACRTAPNLALPQLRSVLLLRSTKALLPESAGVTLVTHTSMDRLRMVERQCTAWPERLAVAVHAPFAAGYGLISMSNATIRRWPEQKVLELVAALHNRTEADPAACALELRVVREDFAAATLTRASSYPVNAVRNRALQLVRTDALVLLDADFLPSATLGALAVDYRRGGAAGREIARYLDEDVVYVLPAFQATTTAFDDAGVRGAAAAAEDGKATIVAALANGSLVGFAANHFPAGHGATNFTRWVNASSQYEVDYQHGFEPYILASRRHVPWYDERFFGYGYNKIEHLTHMWSLGVRWVVHPSAYVVHQPHADSASKELWLLEGNKQTMKNFFKGEVLPEMLGDQFVPVATLPAACSTLDLELGLLEPPATLNVPTVRVRTAIVNWAPFHQEVMAALAYHFQRLGHDVSVFQLRDASQPSTAVEQAMRGFYQREIYESKNFYDSAGAYNIVVFTTPGHCEQAGEECLANAIRISHPASVFLVVHHAREVRALLSHVRREAARGVRLLTLGPHINAAVNQAIERDGDRDLGAAQWIAPVFPVVLPEDCRGDDDGGDDGSGGDNGDIVGDAVPLPVGLDHRGACNRSAVWQSVAKPSAKKQRLSFCLQGNLDNHRRNYSGLFGDITARSAALSAAGVSLVLQGSPGTMEMPTTLIKQHLVRVYQNLTFQEYYELLHSCRAALTSFADDRYFVDTASSSVAASLIGSTPLVASSRLLQAYSYLSADAVFFVDDRMSDADAMAMLAALPDEQLGGRVAAISRLKERLFRRNVAALQKMMAQLQGAQ